MEKDIATLLDAAAFQAADMVGPAIMLEGAGRHLLDRLDLNDPHRFAVISAVGSITAARKSLESAAEELLAVVAQDGADMLAVEVNKGEIVEPHRVRQGPPRWPAEAAIGIEPPPQEQCHSFTDAKDGTLRCVKARWHSGMHCDGAGASWSVGI
ncbi:hypothetical protein CH282_09440 [Rhodococcus sp. 06-418-1B]|nr:hypothetical protein [Rhodococcus sp. 06-418-1B]OZC88342.1 hypothetical protein CH282_09440 [Rhodococcus sp. 06-418-1B]